VCCPVRATSRAAAGRSPVVASDERGCDVFDPPRIACASRRPVPCRDGAGSPCGPIPAASVLRGRVTATHIRSRTPVRGRPEQTRTNILGVRTATSVEHGRELRHLQARNQSRSEEIDQKLTSSNASAFLRHEPPLRLVATVQPGWKESNGALAVPHGAAASIATVTVSRLLALPAHAAAPQAHVSGSTRGNLLNTNGIAAILDLHRTNGAYTGSSAGMQAMVGPQRQRHHHRRPIRTLPRRHRSVHRRRRPRPALDLRQRQQPTRKLG